MPTKAELKKLGKPIKLKVRTGDRVLIISGKDKGQSGVIAAVSPKENKAIVLKDNEENPDQPIPLNRAVKHRKRRSNQERSVRMIIPVPIDVSNLMVLDPETSQPTRIGRKLEDGKIVRFSKKSGKNLPDMRPAPKE